MNLLKEQIKREEKALGRDKQDLEQLEGAFRSSETMQKRQTKTLHPLARLKEDIGDRRQEMASSTSRSAQSVFYVEADDELQTLFQQLHSHLQSMQSNTANLRPLSETLHRAQSALDFFAAGGIDSPGQIGIHRMDSSDFRDVGLL